MGLGTPPLSINHPTIEYLYAPSQDVRRFGNRFLVNAYSMRSPDFAARKTDPREWRVLVLGDSVVNGGSQTDHDELATTLLQQQLEEQLGRPVVVMNASAVSWGPGNLLAYVQEHGFFDADCVVIVVSSHDARDARTFEPIDPQELPMRRPWSALAEGVWRYLPRYLPGFFQASAAPTAASSSSPRPAPVDDRVIEHWASLLGLAQQHAESVVVIQHLQRNELDAPGPIPGLDALQQAGDELGITTFSDRSVMRDDLQPDVELYRDVIHPNARGQQRLAGVMYDAVLDVIPSSEDVADQEQGGP